MNQSEFLAITCNLLKERKKSRVQGVIGFRALTYHLSQLAQSKTINNTIQEGLKHGKWKADSST